ncbi:MAG: phage integrase N-terminal SAM-like domain-containing protein [Gemmatimonadota bacterium]|nr:MAG: phage integrase N-terminal SAM-like domain-containing protein [Gemmatimonadota bacterium]
MTEFPLERIPNIERAGILVRKAKLLDQMRQALRSRHYGRRTEQTYCQWVKRFGSLESESKFSHG